MQKAVIAARVILGLIFAVFAANYFLHLFELPPPNEQAGAFMGALAGTGYVFPVIKVVELVTGVLLIVGVLVPLALTLLAPIIVNIVLIHVLLDSGGLPLAILILILELFLAWAYRGSFSGVLELRAKPTS
jgi:uncharacterized membrane protein YphA (DoxX/SURF4 family)